MRVSTSAVLATIVAFAGQAFALTCTQDYDMGTFDVMPDDCKPRSPGTQVWSCDTSKMTAFRVSQEIMVNAVDGAGVIEATCVDDRSITAYMQCEHGAWGWLPIACPGNGDVSIVTLKKVSDDPWFQLDPSLRG
ncbi:hypothetical protein E4U53_005011 [Claviceps sorghi]|nr:hypothetical protein E4U53_005011 [Claviceps sorghi]